MILNIRSDYEYRPMKQVL